MPSVSKTPVKDVLTNTVVENLDEGLQNGSLHGFEEAPVDGNVLLWGPPGSGKTTESLGRMAAFAADHDLHPRNTTVVTYRTSLADSIRTRAMDWGVFDVDPEDEEETREDVDRFGFWSTAHAVSCRISGFLDEYNHEDDDDLPKHAGMVDSAAKRAFCDEFGVEYSTGLPWSESKWDVFYSLYTYCKQNLLNLGGWTHIPESALRGSLYADQRALDMLDEFHAEWGKHASFKRATVMWESWKLKNECHDFYEQLEAGYASSLTGTEYVIIDELHDAYPLMALVFDGWIEDAERVVVAGDPDQVCNAYTGAHPAIFEGLPSRVDVGMPCVKLPKTHRVPVEHFSAAAEVLSKHRTPPELETRGSGDLYRHTPARQMSLTDSDSWVTLSSDDAASPARLYEHYGSDIMFLARTQMLVDALGACLDEAGIMYKSQNTVAGDWELRRAVMSALRKVETVRPARQTAVTDSEAYENTAGASVTETPESTSKTLSYGEAEAIANHTDERLLSVSRSEFKTEIRAVERENNTFTFELLADLVDLDWWSVYGQGHDSLSNLVNVNAYAGFTGNESRDIESMRRAWERYDELPRVSTLETKLWTLHASKGDEAEHAVVYTGVTGRVRDACQKSDEDAENESRTWYVALTRAKQGLHLVHDAFDVTCGNYEVIGDDLESKAVKIARKRLAARTDGGEQ